MKRWISVSSAFGRSWAPLPCCGVPCPVAPLAYTPQAPHPTCTLAPHRCSSAFLYALPQVALATAGILPSDATAYPTRKLSAAVEDAFGVAPLLSCWHGQLLELWLCVGLDLKVGWRVVFIPLHSIFECVQKQRCAWGST